MSYSHTGTLNKKAFLFFRLQYFSTNCTVELEIKTATTLKQIQVRNSRISSHYILEPIFCQDRFGTNIGNVEKKRRAFVFSQRFLDERFGIRVQHKQLSLERNHVYRVNNADVAKRCRDGIKAALAAKPRVDLAKLRAFSR